MRGRVGIGGREVEGFPGCGGGGLEGGFGGDGGGGGSEGDFGRRGLCWGSDWGLECQLVGFRFGFCEPLVFVFEFRCGDEVFVDSFFGLLGFLGGFLANLSEGEGEG